MVYAYNDPNGAQQTITVNLSTISLQTSFNTSEINDGTYPIGEASFSSVPVISSIQLPNGTSYTFTYEQNGFGGIKSITLPQGGTITYNWATLSDYSISRRYVSSRSVNDGVSTTTWGVQLATSYSSPTTTATVTDPAGNQSILTSSAGKVYNAAFYAGSVGGTPMRNVEVDYAAFAGTEGSPSVGAGDATEDGLPARIITTEQNNLQNKVEYDYDEFEYSTADCSDAFGCSQNGSPNVGQAYASRGNVRAIRTYDWGNGSPGPLLRQTINHYLYESNGSYANSNIVSKISEADTYDGSSTCNADTPCSANLVKKTVYTYDQATQAGPYYGEVTAAARWVNTPTSAYLTTTYSYDSYGNIISETDPKNNVTTYGYTDAWSGSTACAPSGNSNAYLTSITNAAGQKEAQTFYQCTGQIASDRDANDVAASRPGATYSYELMGRPYTTTLPDGGQTQNTYNDSAHTVDVQTLISAGSAKDVLTQLDGLGRTIQTKLNSDPSGADYVDTTYDSMGRVGSVSNPYRSKNDSTYGITSYLYDALSRKLDQCQPDNSSQPSTTCTPASSYQSWKYTGNSVLFTDENGHSWTRASDALGRLTQVLEPDANNGQTIETDYAYDPLSNLARVDQWGALQSSGSAATDRVRTFTYDSLSRLLSSINPESGSIQYTYTTNGSTLCSGDSTDVCTRTDARNVTTTYSYHDPLNRLTGKSYTIPPNAIPAIAATQSVSYTYDSPAAGWSFPDQTSPSWTGVTQQNLIGRLSSESNTISTVVLGYDPMGRTNLKSTCTPLTCSSGDHYDIHGTYDLAGDPTFMDRGLKALENAASPNAGYYYGGLTMGYNAAAQLYSATADISDANHPQSILSQMTYNPFGKVQTVELGAQYAQVSQYDQRARMTGRVSGNLAGYTVLADAWHYDPVGNVKEANDSQQGDFFYYYDPMNRVTSGTTSNESTSYVYDNWGNQSSHVVTAGSNYQWAAQPNGQNQVGASGSSFDASGNMTADGLHSYQYDAENRLAAVSDQSLQYVYDPEGLRVATASGGSVTAEYLYDFSSSLVTTVGNNGMLTRAILRAAGTHWGDYTSGTGSGGGSTEFRLVNQVGTLVANGDSNGNYVEGCLSGPYGDGQLCTPGYDYTETHFADKLRDAATNNDYFGARYYSSTLGRFLSPDWSDKPQAVPYADLMIPQSLNLYGYVKNNPLSAIDPNGHQEAIPTPFGPLPLIYPQQQMTPQQMGQVAQDVSSFVSTLGQVISQDASAIGSVISNIFSSSQSSDNPAPAAQPLVGNNPKESGTRTNTDLPGGHKAAADTFSEQTSGQSVRTDPKTGHQVSEDGSRLRLNPDGTARVDLPNRGDKPNGETIHFNIPDVKPE